jgi:thiol-disulfide isomerase/thioredoxin
MRRAALFLIATALLAGLTKAAPAAAKRAAGAYQPVALTNDWRTRVQLVSVTHDQWLRELQALHGRIVVVDNWATWCIPCVERFPRMMEIARRWSPSGAVFVTLSLDDRDDPQSLRKVQKFLEKHDARIPNYLMNEITPDAFDKLGLLGIPAVFIYDRSGRLTQRLTGDNPNNQYTEADVEAALRTLDTAK